MPPSLSLSLSLSICVYTCAFPLRSAQPNRIQRIRFSKRLSPFSRFYLALVLSSSTPAPSSSPSKRNVLLTLTHRRFEWPRTSSRGHQRQKKRSRKRERGRRWRGASGRSEKIGERRERGRGARLGEKKWRGGRERVNEKRRKKEEGRREILSLSLPSPPSRHVERVHAV